MKRETRAEKLKRERELKQLKVMPTLDINPMLIGRRGGGGVGMSGFLQHETANVIAGFPTEPEVPPPTEFQKIKSNVEALGSGVSGLYSAYQGYQTLKAKRGQIRDTIKRFQERFGRTVQDVDGEGIDNDIADMESILGRGSRLGSLIDDDNSSFRSDADFGQDTMDSLAGDFETPRVDMSTPRVGDDLPDPPTAEPRFAGQRGISQPTDEQVRPRVARFTDAEPEGQELEELGETLPRVPLRPPGASDFAPTLEGRGLSLGGLSEQRAVANLIPRTEFERQFPLDTVRSIRRNISAIERRPEFMRTTGQRMFVEERGAELRGPRTNIASEFGERFDRALSGVQDRLESLRGRIANNARSLTRQIGEDARFDQFDTTTFGGSSESENIYGSLNHATEMQNIGSGAGDIGQTAGTTADVSELTTGAGAGETLGEAGVVGTGAGVAEAGTGIAEATTGVSALAGIEEAGEVLGTIGLAFL